MAIIRSLMEMTPAELISRPMVRQFAPFREQVIRCRARVTWKNPLGREWFWVGRAMDSAHTLVVGPYRTKRGATNAWASVPLKDPRYFWTDDEGTKHYVEPPPPAGERALQKSFSDYHKG